MKMTDIIRYEETREILLNDLETYQTAIKDLTIKELYNAKKVQLDRMKMKLDELERLVKDNNDSSLDKLIIQYKKIFEQGSK